MSRIAFVGHLNIEDTHYPDRSAHLKAPGGAALYAASAARLWGSNSVIVSRIGENYPKDELNAMHTGGLNLAYVKTVDGPTMAGSTSYDPNGNRKYQMYTPPERRLLLTPEPEDLTRNELDNIDAVHLATMLPERQEAWLKKVRSSTPLISMDTDVSLVRIYRQKLLELLKLVDIFIPSSAEVEAFFPNMCLEEAARELALYGPSIIGIKLGQKGAYIWLPEQNRDFSIPSIPIDVVDVTGAGDAFCGGFLAMFLETGDEDYAAWAGAASASLAINDYGALHLLKRDRSIAETLISNCMGEITE
jgi:ribokinase